MPEITVNSDRKIYARKGEVLLDVLRNAGIYIKAPCGGKGICRKCTGRLAGKEILLCRTVVSEDMDIDIPYNINGECSEFNGFSENGNYAAVIDIGSTTIKIAFFNLDSGQCMKSCSYINMQQTFGADVVSRVEYAVKNGAEALYNITAKQIEDIIAKEYTGDIKRLRKIAVSGNTVMEHIFCREDISGFAEYPFRTVFLNSRIFSSKKLGYSFDAEVTVMPCASAFIGADAVGGIMTCFREGEDAVFVDIGTNAEMAVFSGGKIYTASAAAGPAFEGGRISCGTGCIDGAINHVDLKKDSISVSTINGQPSVGVCGSGLIDIAAGLLDSGIMDRSGHIDESSIRYFKDKGFNIIRNIYITQSDIRELQTAKSAVYSGLSALIKKAGMGEKPNILYLCGGIGEYINTDNAVKIKFLPDIKMRRMGNTSIKGAAAVLFEDKLGFAEETAAKCRETILADDEYFCSEFIKNMDF